MAQYIVVKHSLDDEFNLDTDLIFHCYKPEYISGWTEHIGTDRINNIEYYRPKRFYFLHWRYLYLLAKWIWLYRIYYPWKFRKWVWINTGPMKPDIILSNDNERLRV